jgi:hypothetical protein
VIEEKWDGHVRAAPHAHKKKGQKNDDIQIFSFWLVFSLISIINMAILFVPIVAANSLCIFSRIFFFFFRFFFFFFRHVERDRFGFINSTTMMAVLCLYFSSLLLPSFSLSPPPTKQKKKEKKKDFFFALFFFLLTVNFLTHTNLQVLMLVSVAILLLVAASVRAGRFSDTLAFTGDVEKDFTTGADLKPRKGVIKIGDALRSLAARRPSSRPTSACRRVRSGPAVCPAGTSRTCTVQVDFDTGALHLGINCFGVCGDADGDGDPNAASMVLVQAGGNDNPDFALSESFAVGSIWAARARTLAGDGKMDFVVGYPAQLGDQSDRFPCGDRFDISCFGVYFFQAGAFDQPGTRFVYKTAAYNGFPAGLLAKLSPRVARPQPEADAVARRISSGRSTDFNGFRTDAGYDQVDLNAVIPWEMNLVGFAGSFQDDGIGEDFLPNNAPFVTVRFPCQAFDACDVCGGNGQSCADCAACRTARTATTRATCAAATARRAATAAACRTAPTATTCATCAPATARRAATAPACRMARRATTCATCATAPAATCAACAAATATRAATAAATQNGTCQYDACDVCCGDGLSCVEVPPERDPCIPRFESKLVCQVFPGRHVCRAPRQRPQRRHARRPARHVHRR